VRIAHLSAEVTPFAKSGGLGDVVGALPKAQAELGHDVSVWMPLYRQAQEKIGSAEVVSEGVLRTTLPGSEVPLFLIAADQYFDRKFIYSPSPSGEDDGIARYSYFVRAVFAAMQRLWNAPEILHAHDWHAALAPMALAWNRDWVFNDTRTVFTIHNLAYQGIYPPSMFGHLGLPAATFPQVEFDGAINLMKGAIVAADVITAVSPTYAREITTPDGGFGLDPILRMRRDRLVGIVNGIDPLVWNPATDPKIAHHYDASDRKSVV